MNLKLSKSLAFFDLETTGINISKDRIVEISICKINVDGSKESYTQRINPQIPIPLEVSEIHGIYDIDVKNQPTFAEVGKNIANFIGESDLSGYNSNNFDIPLLAEEMMRAQIDFDFKSRKFIDVQNIFYKKEQRTLSAAYQFYCNKELENAHSAEADVLATFEVLESQINKYEDLEPTVDFLSEFSTMGNKKVDFAGRFIENNDGEVVFNFGKHKGKAVKQILKKDPSYYSWMMQGDFPLYTKKVIQDIKNSLN